MVDTQHKMSITKDKFLVFWQLKVSDFEATDRFLLYSKSGRKSLAFFQSKEVAEIDLCCKTI